MALRTVFRRNCQRIWNKCSETSRNVFMPSNEISVSKMTYSQFSFPTTPKETNNTHYAIKGSSVFSNSRVPSLGFLPGSSITIDHKISFSLPLVIPVRHYQSVLRPRLHCKGCFFVWRHGRKFVECSDVPSHKQMKKLPTRKVWLEDYSRGDINVAMKWNRDLARIADRHVDKTVVSHNWLASRIGKDV